MELDELAERLQALEDDKLKSSFMDKYGQRFSGDEGIGVAVLAELQRRGIDTSAADDAVQEILNQIRAEAQVVLDKIVSVQQEVIQQMDKIQAIDDAVQGAIADQKPTEEPPAPEGTPAPEMPMPPEGGEMPPAPEGTPAPEMPMPPESGEMPSAPEGGEMPPEQVISDERAKTIKSLLDKKRKSATGWKPNKSMIAACRG